MKNKKNQNDNNLRLKKLVIASEKLIEQVEKLRDKMMQRSDE